MTEDTLNASNVLRNEIESTLKTASSITITEAQIKMAFPGKNDLKSFTERLGATTSAGVPDGLRLTIEGKVPRS